MGTTAALLGLAGRVGGGCGAKEQIKQFLGRHQERPDLRRLAVTTAKFAGDHQPQHGQGTSTTQMTFQIKIIDLGALADLLDVRGADAGGGGPGLEGARIGNNDCNQERLVRVAVHPDLLDHLRLAAGGDLAIDRIVQWRIGSTH